MFPLGVRIAAFFSVPMVVATSASAEEKKKAVRVAHLIWLAVDRESGDAVVP